MRQHCAPKETVDNDKIGDLNSLLKFVLPVISYSTGVLVENLNTKEKLSEVCLDLGIILKLLSLFALLFIIIVVVFRAVVFFVNRVMEELFDPLNFKAGSFEDEWDLRRESVSNDDEQQKKVQEFQSEFESKKDKCAVLIVNSTSAPDKWTIAGYNDKGQFMSVVIDDPSNEL